MQIRCWETLDWVQWANISTTSVAPFAARAATERMSDNDLDLGLQVEAHLLEHRARLAHDARAIFEVLVPVGRQSLQSMKTSARLSFRP